MRDKIPRTAIFGVLILLCCSLLSFRFFDFTSRTWTRTQLDKASVAASLSSKFVLMDVEEAIVVTIGDDQPQPEKTKEKCTHYTCFDVYRCGRGDSIDRKRIGVYVYPVRRYVDSSGILISSPFTEEYWQIIEAISKSQYYTPDPEAACLFVPTIDVLSQSYVRLDETSQALNSLPFWNEGSNHILFNMLPGSYPDYNRIIDLSFGKALVAGGGFDSWSYRQGFDVSIPVYSPHSAIELAANKKMMDTTSENDMIREWFLVSTQIDAMNAKSKDTILELETTFRKRILTASNRCQLENSSKTTNTTNYAPNRNARCNKLRNLGVNYPSILQKSVFCLIAKTAYLGSPLLSDSLMSGCIPVLAIDEYIPPFPEVIDWKRCSIRVHERSLQNLVQILDSISPDRRAEMRHQARFVWETYFSTLKAITLTALGIINDRLIPYAVVPKEDKNEALFSFSAQRPPSLVSPKMSFRVSQGFTAVILTYERKILFDVIKRVIQSPSCVKVVVVWNSQKKKPPPADKWPQINVPLQIIQTAANKLSNRFYPYAGIETDAILAIDDDIVMLNGDELEFGYQVWREFPDRLVGFPSRVHRWDNGTAKWKYESVWTNDVSMVLTGAAFYHKYYNYLYTFVMPSSIRTWVDENMNCEDIAMNFLVSNVTGKAPIKVTPRKKFKCPECSNGEMLSADVIRHLSERSDCINRFAGIYGTMPLRKVEFRADPVLFKDNLPEKLKKFNQVGTI